MKKRIDISRLNRNRAIYFKVGLIVSLSFTIVAFNYTVYDFSPPQKGIIIVEEIDDIEIQRTKHELPPVLPPPAVTPTENIVEAEEVEFIEEPLPEKKEQKVEPTPSVEIVKVPPKPVVKRRPAPELEPEPEPTTTAPTIFIVVEEMPRFGDCGSDEMTKAERKMCSDKSLMRYLSKSIRYPSTAKENNIQGTVVIEFIVDEEGKVTNAKVVKDIGGGCGKEALRVVKQMPEWIPGMQLARNVKVKMNLPVKFALQ